MTLDEYLALPGNTAAQLAAAAKTSGATITRLLYGEAQPSADMIRAIVEATGGDVTADDLLFGAPRPKPEKAA
jgi:transcriptional regulator with XRE-family HTH domain